LSSLTSGVQLPSAQTTEVVIKRRHPEAKCEECSLNVPSAAFVPTQQPKSGRTKLAIVGEAPGYKEGRTGVPFTGPSGQLLDAVLRGHGLSREDTLVTNACLCRPRDNATPTSRDVAACSGRLSGELKQATAGGAPIVALGNVAAAAVFGHKVTITSFRTGPAKESELYPGIRVIPTVHPAYVLRQQDAFKLFSDDIGKVNVNVDVRWEAPIFRVFDEPFEASRALQELCGRPGDMVIDIEIGSEKDTQFVHPDQYQLLCVGLGYAPGRAIVIGETALRSGRRDNEGPVRHMLSRALESGRIRNVAHNGKFDLAGVNDIAPKATLGFDTMLASYAVDERPGTHGLKYLIQERLGGPDYSAEIHKYLDRNKNFANIPRDILYKYNAYDVVGTYALKEMYENTMTSDEFGVHDMLCWMSDMMMHAEMKGLTVDVDYLSALSDELEGRLYKIERMMYKLFGLANPRSPMQVKASLAEMGIHVASTDEAHMIMVQRGNIKPEAREFIKLLMKHRKYAKQYGTYVKGIFKRLYQGRVHPSFLLHGTTTGRLASRNPNLFNIPRESAMRRMFVPSPGKKFVQADYKGAELRVIACEAKDEYLRQLFIDRRDIHNEVATRFFGPGFTKDQRVRAKAVVFGLSYGREEFSLAQEYDIPVEEAKAYLDAFFELIPDTKRWREEVTQQILHGEDDLRSHFGRHRRIWLVTDDNVKDVVKEGLAFIPQANASDITLHAARVLTEEYGLDFRLYVYDSILVECDPGDVEDVSKLMAEVMPRVAKEMYSDYVPFDVDVSSGDSWGEL
jgi:uracil-DNA glycosylase family 4